MGIIRHWWRLVRDEPAWSGVRLWVDAFRDYKAMKLRAKRRASYTPGFKDDVRIVELYAKYVNGVLAMEPRVSVAERARSAAEMARSEQAANLDALRAAHSQAAAQNSQPAAMQYGVSQANQIGYGRSFPFI